MIYREYGRTGKSVSAIGFGGMRFESIDNKKVCIEMMLEAAKGGINYFDTAPKYFGDRSEKVFGEGFEELRKNGFSFYCATKTMEAEEGKIRKEIEAQLKRLRVSGIDFYHAWCVTDLPSWEARKRKGLLAAFRKLKEEGLIRHICVSSHLSGDEIRELLMEGVFEGVLFGYSGYNFKTRHAAFDAIRQHELGCVIMNPLGGGLIPKNPGLFEFLKTQEHESIVEAALRFLLAHDDITVSLVGFENITHVREALTAVNGYKPIGREKLLEIMDRAAVSFEGICTGCQYCDECPQGIQIPKFMDSYNQKILHGDSKQILDRLRWHWNITPDEASRCIECGQCETACTQHIDIISRLREITDYRLSLKHASQN